MSQVYQQMWLSLSPEVRAVLAHEFGLRPTGQRSVIAGGPGGIKVQSDGFTAGDLLQINIAQLQSFTGEASSDFDHLWHAAVVKATKMSAPVTEPDEPAKKPVGRPRKEV
jgi:hypothetical protein